MGWARTLLLGDIGNRLDIGDAEEDIAALRRTLKKKANTDRSQDARLEALEQENDMLKLCVATLGRLLVGKGILTIQDLSGFAELIDETR
jgi:hypothetical protein